MPTVLTLSNVRVAIYLNDHPPPHVHAIGPDGKHAKFALNCPDGPVRLTEQRGFRLSEIAEIGAAIAGVLPALCERWRQSHGRF